MTARDPADLAAPEQAPRQRRGLSRWPIRRKLVALVAIPLFVILAGGAVVTAEAVRDLRAAQTADTITSAASQSNALAQQLQRELVSTLSAINNNDAVGPRIAVRREWKATDDAFAGLLKTLADPPGGSWDYSTQQRVNTVTAQREQLARLRKSVFNLGLIEEGKPGGPTAPSAGVASSEVQSRYSGIIDAPRQLTQRLGQRLATTATNGATVNTAAAISALAEVSTAAAQELALTDVALIDVQLDRETRGRIESSRLRQTDLLALARVHATDDQQQSIDALNAEDQAVASLREDALKVFLDSDVTKKRTEISRIEPQFRSRLAQRLTNLDGVVAQVVADGEVQASQAARAALTRVGIVGGGALLVLLLATAFTAFVARSVSNPLRRLRSAAVETASVRLPAAVQQIDREGPDAPVVMPPALPAGEAGGPETAEVARAFDGLTAEAIRLATAQVRLRRSLDDAFVSMSRRSQSMVEKQLAIIDELERTEEDPDQLRNLFRLDHLAARMRRYNDNLLVLAGSVVRTRSNAPVPIADVFRAATSEMEQYERVRLQPVSGAAVAGPSAGGLIHLLAELLDNAAMYSPPTSPILMAAAFTSDGALRLEITDSGVGIPPSELADLNMRLASPGSFDMQVPSRMGLYVVARLAQRGGFGVQLAQRQAAAGTVAEVVVPSHLVIGGSGLVAEPPRTPTSLPQVGAPADQSPVSPARGVPATTGSSGATAAEAGADRDTAPVRRTPAVASTPPGHLPRRTRGEVPPVPADAPAAVNARTADDSRSGQPPARRGQPATPAVASDAPLAPLPSRRPGAALAAGPLAAAATTPFGATTDGGSPSPFAMSASTPSDVTRLDAAVTGDAGLGGARPDGAMADAGDLDAAAGNGATAGGFGTNDAAANGAASNGAGSNGAASNGAGSNGTGSHGAAANGTSAPPTVARAAGGFGVPARPFTAGAPASGRRAAGVGAPSAATAAAAAAAARAARSGGAAAGTASALFAARGPATDGRGGGVPAVPADGAGPTPTPSDGVAANTADAPTARTEGQDRPASTTGSVDRPDTPAAPAAWDHGAASEAARGSSPAAVPPLVQDATPAEPSREQALTANPGPAEPLTGEVPISGADRAGTPIFDTVSMWFTTDGTTGETERVIDLRDRPDGTPRATSSRWSSLGDQRWLATNARAAAGPEVAGTTEVGLPRRRPGANLLASAAAAAPLTAPVARPEPSRRTPASARARVDVPGRADADLVRGRLSSYQRGLTSARRARHLPADRTDTGLFAAGAGDDNPGHTPGEQGG